MVLLAVTFLPVWGCGPNVADIQSDARAYDLDLSAPVKAAGSDVGTWRFRIVEMPELIEMAGATPHFLLVSGRDHVFTELPVLNPDNLSHMAAVAAPDSPYLRINFEGLPGGGDHDYGGAALVVEMSEWNVAALLGRSVPREFLLRFLTWLGLLLGVVATPVVVIWTRRRARKRRLSRQFEQVSALVESGQPLEAVALVRKTKESVSNRHDWMKWTVLELEASERASDMGNLCELFWDAPQWFAERETLSLAVGRAQIYTEQFEGYAALRKIWQERERQPIAWLALDCDLFMGETRPDKARKLLEQSADVDQDGALSARLALLQIMDDAQDKDAMKRAAKAVQLAPRNPDVLTLAAMVCEHAGDRQQAATYYQTAFSMAPGDALVRDRYAEFCRRGGDFGGAISLWRQGLAAPSMDFIWTKFLFWTRVARPVPVDMKSLSPPEGPLRPLIVFIQNLDLDQFFDLRSFQELADYHPHLLTRPETYWLRVLEALRAGRETEALALLNLEHARWQTWQPDLEAALVWIILYRQSGMLGLVGARPEPDKQSRIRNPFYESLRDAADKKEAPAELHGLLKSTCAFAAACFAAGWQEAGLGLLPTVLPPECPDWVFEQAKRALHYRNEIGGPALTQ